MKRSGSILWLLVLSVSLCSGTTHIIVNSGFSFSPSSLNITLGDTVVFSLAGIHNAVEVSQTTWNANGTTPLPGGFALPLGGGTVVLTTLGTHWYVCQPHASSGMKGTITVNPVPPPPPPPLSTIQINSLADRDGSLGTTTDRVGKPWSLRLYQDSVGSGIIVDSVDSATNLIVDSLTSGVYVAVEADSQSWIHISQTVDGSPQGLTAANFRSITVSGGEDHTVDFINTVPNMIINDGFTFSPDTMVVDSADTVWFVLESVHNAREVGFSTWAVDDTTSNGGFDLPFGGGSAEMTQVGTTYYVCVPHASISMKGVIIVKPTGTFSGSVSDGWNLLSLPLIVTDSLVSTLYPDAVSAAFTYAAGYVAQSEVPTGVGYWIKYVGSHSINIDGTEFPQDTIPVTNGWNIIGSVSYPVETASITSVPGGLVTSAFFGYDAGYITADTIQPGLGYWVKISGSGSLVLSASSSMSGKAERIRIVPTADMPPSPPHQDLVGTHTPGNFHIRQNYPNPFNPSTEITYTIPAEVHVSLKIYDVLGREVVTLVDGKMDAGSHSVVWTAEGAPSGVYLYRLTAGNHAEMKKMVLLR